MAAITRTITRSIIAASLVVVGCTNDPVYLPQPTTLEAGTDDGMMGITEAAAAIQVPVVLETDEDRMEREALQATLDPLFVVPYVRMGDLEISVEWTIRNLTDTPGNATIQLNGANQFFEYDPLNVLISMDDEAPPAPPLLGDIPLEIPASGELHGIFREDELREASIDLDQITRGNINPFRATLVVDRHKDGWEQLPPPVFDDEGNVAPPPPEYVAPVFPREVFPQMLCINIVFRPDRHMALDYTVRVRDVRRDTVHELGLAAFTDAEAMAELEPFAPAPYVVGAAMAAMPACPPPLPVP